MPTYTGNNGDNTINGSNGNDTISGLGGEDTLAGGNGNDTISGGEGDDEIDGGNGNDDLSGDGGNDEIDGGNGNDDIDGGDDDDIIFGGNGGDTLNGGTGNDQLFGENGNDHLTGGAGDDLIDGNNGFDTAYYSGNIGEYSFFSAAGYLHVLHLGGAGADGHDQVIRVERLVFADRVINIGSGSNAPVAGDDHVFINEDTGVYSSGAASVKDNDFDFDGDALTVTGGIFVGTYGTLTLNANGTYSYALNASAQTLAQGQNVTDSFNYTVSDNDGSDTGALVFHIAGVNDAPTANPDTDTTSENAVLLVNVLTNDTDIDNGAVLTVTTASAPAGQGSASVVGNQVQFDPGTDFDDLNVGDSEVVVVSYTISDEHGATASSTLTITVTGTNDGPIANPDTDTTSENAILLVDVLANDTDVDSGAALTVTAASAPAGQGTASVVGNQVQFDPGTDFDDLNVGDSQVVVVSYDIEDEHGATASSTLTITVTGTNDGPMANPDTDTTSENSVLVVDVLANDTDIDNGAMLTVTAASAPAGQGSASVVGNQVEFDPGSDFDYLAVGENEVVVVGYDIEDEHGATDSSTLTITVTGTNDAPTIDAGGTDDAGSVTELPNNDPNENAFTHTDSGTIAFDDLDLSDTHSASFTPQAGGYLGTFSLDPVNQAGDTVGWDFSVEDSDIDFLADGQTLTQVYEVEIDDGNGGTVTQDVTITITGETDSVPPDGTNWYIDNSAIGSANTGSPSDPFVSIAAFNAVQGTLGGPGVGDNIFLLAGLGTYSEADGINLLNGQTLTGVAAGPLRPTIVTTGGGSDGIEVAQNNTISGLDIGNTNDVGIADSGGSVGTLTISDVGKTGTGQIVDIDQGGTLNVTLNVATSTGSNDGAIDLEGLAGSFTVTGATTITGIHSDGGIDITNSSLTATFAGGGTVSTNNAIAVNFVGNTGALVLDGGLDIVTTTGTGLNATGGGTLTVTGAGNSISAMFGSALNVANTTIGAAGATFESISAGGGVNGIVLTNTGALAGLTVTGDGGGTNNGSGGTIQNATGDGILLTNTQDVRLGYMNIQANADNGIGGSGIHGFVLDRVNITANGNSAATDDAGIDIVNLTGTSSVGARPTAIINSVISNNHEFEVQIVNSSGSLVNLQVIGSQITSNGATLAHGNLFNFLATGTASMGIKVSGSTFDGNTVVGALTATGLNVDASGGSIQADIGTSNFIENNVGVSLSAATTGTLVFNVHDNVLTGSRGNAINFSTTSGASGSFNGTIQDNVVGTLGVPTSGSLLGRGINVTTSGGGTANLLIDDNTVQATGVEGISVVDNVTGGTTNVTITDNVIRDIVNQRGINVQTAGAGNTINSSVSGNSFINVPGPADLTALRFNEGVGSVLNVSQLAPTVAVDPNEVDDANGIANTRVSIAGTPQFGQPAPTLPSGPSLPLLAASEGPGAAADDLSQGELDQIAAAAIDRWAAAGASDQQLAAMRATLVSVADMAGPQLGSSGFGTILIDSDGAGWGWFVDQTPGEDSEFGGSGSSLVADAGSAADGRMDLLTALMHEFGHQAGLGHGGDGEVMDAQLAQGERLLPDQVFTQAGANAANGEDLIGADLMSANVAPFYSDTAMV